MCVCVCVCVPPKNTSIDYPTCMSGLGHRYCLSLALVNKLSTQILYTLNKYRNPILRWELHFNIILKVLLNKTLGML